MNTDYVIMTDKLSETMQKLYSTKFYEIMDAIISSNGLTAPVECKTTIPNGFINEYVERFNTDCDGNILVTDGMHQFRCNNIVAICDITNYMDYANKHYDTQLLKIAKYFFINLMRYAERYRDELFSKNGIDADDTKSIIFRIDGHYYFDLDSLEKELK